MSPRRRYVLVTALSTGLVLALLVLVSLDRPLEGGRSQGAVVLRDVQIAQPPPEPPPPVETITEERQPLVDIEIDQRSSPNSLLANAELDVDIPAADVTGQRFGRGAGVGTDGAGVAWDGFDLPALDALPTVVSAPLIEYPEALLERGVTSMEIEVLIRVDKEGNTTLLEIISTPYPPFNDELRDFVSGVRFTPPRVQGEKVTAVYVWPVGIHAEELRRGQEPPARTRRRLP